MLYWGKWADSHLLKQTLFQIVYWTDMMCKWVGSRQNRKTVYFEKELRGREHFIHDIGILIFFYC